MYKATRVVLWLTILFQFPDVWSEDSAGKSVVLDLLVYNTHGLPTLLAFDQPRRRFPIISTLANLQRPQPSVLCIVVLCPTGSIPKYLALHHVHEYRRAGALLVLRIRWQNEH